jgi:hypothetical protein
MRVVDLGTKKGSAIGVFLKRGAMYYGNEIRKIKPGDCVGIDLADKYRETVEKRGFQFQAKDVLEAQWHKADYYLAWDFLEHLPSISESKKVLGNMLAYAGKGVWLKMPSFEQDDTGEGQLKKHGLRFTWTNWHGHPSAFCLNHAYRTIDECKRVKNVKHKTQRIIRDSSDKFVVPIDAPVDVTEYKPEYGKKPKVKFDPPVIGCHELIVYLEK